MATSSIDGLVSGLDTTSVINQLIALERAPADRLSSRKAKADAAASAYGTLKSRVDSVKAAFEALDASTDWSPAKATSSKPEAVSVSADAGAKPGSLSFTVTRLATAHTVVSTGEPKAADASWSGAEIVLNVGGTDHTIAVPPDAGGERTLAQVAEAVNGAGLGILAQAVQVSPGQFRLQLTAEDTGEAARFSVVSGLDGTYDTAVEGVDAEIELAAGLYRATSPTNTFADLLPGVDVTLKAASPDPVTISVSRDADAVTNKVRSLVTALNAAVNSVRSLTAYDPASNRASVLTGDLSARRLSQDLVRAVVDPVDGAGTLASTLGITVERDGTLAFDEVKFAAALADDPTAAEALFVQADGAPDNIGTRLAQVVEEATGAGRGYLLTAQESQRDRAKAYTAQIEDIERRLERSADRLRRQFTAMETALSSMQSQSNWLATQIAGLPAAG